MCAFNTLLISCTGCDALIPEDAECAACLRADWGSECQDAYSRWARCEGCGVSLEECACTPLEYVFCAGVQRDVPDCVCDSDCWRTQRSGVAPILIPA